jgi:Domain of unknown function (DUF1707)
VPVATGPGHQVAAGAAGRGRLRTSRADREQAIEVLKAAFVEDRLTKDEFDARVAEALASRTYADLAALTADIPAGPGAVPPPEPARAQGRKLAGTGARVLVAATVPTAGLWAGALFSQTDNQALSGFVATFTCIWLGVVILTVALMLESRRQKRAGGRRPPAVGPDVRAASRAGRFPQVDRGQQHTAEATRPDPRPWLIPGW